jgi:hypothetical protein
MTSNQKTRALDALERHLELRHAAPATSNTYLGYATGDSPRCRGLPPRNASARQEVGLLQHRPGVHSHAAPRDD